MGFLGRPDEAPPGKKGMVGGQFDPRFEPERRQALFPRQRLGVLQERPPHAASLKGRQDSELADIEAFFLRLQEHAADQHVPLHGEKPDFLPRLLGKCVGCQPMGGGWRVYETVHEGESREDQRQQRVQAVEIRSNRADFRHCPPLRRLYFNVSKRAANPS